MQLGARNVADVLAGELDGAALAVDEAQERAAGGRFATTRFAYQGQCLAGIEVETDFLDGMHATLNATEETAADIEAGDQILDAQDWRFGTHGILWLGDLRRRVRCVDAQQVELARQRAAMHRAEFGHGSEQGAGIGVLRAGKDLGGGAGFDAFAAVHDLHSVGDFGDYAHVVRDENDAHLHFVLQCADERQDLRLDGHVEGGGRFVGNQERGFAGQCHGDHHPLAHAPRELVRVALEDVTRFGDAYQIEHAQGFGTGCCAIHALVFADRFGDLLAGGEHRVERGHRLLEDHRNVRTTDTAHRRVVGAGEIEDTPVATAESEASADDAPAAVFDEAHRREGGDRLARSGFADDGQRFTAGNME